MAKRFFPSEEWLAAFQAQYSGTMTQLVEGYAAQRVAGLGASPRNDDYYARELVLNALSDTLLGAVRWNPATKNLTQHIKDVVKRRTSIDWKRAKKYPHHSIDATTQDGQSPTLDEVNSTLIDRLPDPQATENALEVLAELLQRAAGDPELLAYIEARADGVPRTELMRVLDLSPTEYQNVRRRLGRLTKQLSMQARPKQMKRGQ